MKASFRISGKDYDLSDEDVEAALSGKDPERIYDYAVWVGGRWYPPKQALVTPIGLKNRNVNSRQAYGILGKLGLPRHDQRTEGPLPDSPSASADSKDAVETRMWALELAVELTAAGSGSSADAVGAADRFIAWLKTV